MIKPGEIQQKANAMGVRDQQIEKDYILSWILFGISKHEQLSKAIVFKGGTVLKKVYFEEYRFSEDLDFTLLNSEISNEIIFVWIKEVFEFIRDEANIPLEIIDNMEEEGVRLPDEQDGLHFYISYIGPLGGQGNNKKVKVDISRREQLVFEPIMNNVFIGYSDMEEHRVFCYPLEEVLVEKMRSVMQRMQARDFYDIWYLLEVHEMDAGFYINQFEAKCKSKDLKHTDFHKKLDERLPQYKGRWKSSLSEQIKNLPDFEQVVREVQRNLKKLKF
ncbi:MAG: nucleotidyl transferase AbiEii/AbiGii toxin family protein [Ferruginibacter sp.]|nr:nucleotidyl transferase AbiEii/AbiGii toxin family protein [Ferruginibacter sp.]